MELAIWPNASRRLGIAGWQDAPFPGFGRMALKTVGGGGVLIQRSAVAIATLGPSASATVGCANGRRRRDVPSLRRSLEGFCDDR